ncbi:hypothetical protein [Corynebacterium sp. HMSC036D03]|nr:hypothetical protein [Corynebacterium sp. HMSC036D03]
MRSYTPFRESTFKSSQVAQNHAWMRCDGQDRRRPHKPYGYSAPRY